MTTQPIHDVLTRARAEVRKVIIGQDDVIDKALHFADAPAGPPPTIARSYTFLFSLTRILAALQRAYRFGAPQT